MNDLLWWLAQNTIIVALLVPPVLLASWMLRHRPAVQHLLCFVVLLKLVTPPLVVWPWSVAELRGAVSDATLHESSAEVALAQPSPEVFAPVPLETAANLPANAVPSAKKWNFSILPWSIWGLGAIWFGGAVVTLASQLRMIRCHAQLIRGGTEPPRVLQEQVAALAREIGVRSPQIWMVAGINSPMVWCLGRLTLLWPESLSSPQDCQRLQSVIAHELAHLRRCDHWVAWLDLAARIVWWWNPLYWFVSRRVCESAEMACDAMAIASGNHKRGDYAKLLLELSASFQTATPAAILGVGTGNRASFERRLAMILSERVSSGRPLWGIVVAVALGMSAWPAWSLAQPRNSEKQGPSKEDGTAKEETVTISARVADHEGQPIAGAKVWWVSNHRLRVNRIETATTDEEGRFIVSPPKDHQYPWGRLWVYKEDKQVATAAVGFRPEESVLKIASVKRSSEGRDRLGIYYHESTDAVIILDPANDIDFRIVAPDGSPAVGVAVEPSNYMASPTHSERFPDPLLAILTTTTNTEGRVHFTNLSRWWLGSVLIRSDKLGMQDFYFHRGQWDDLSVEKTIQLRSTGRVEGQLEADDRQWTRGATVTVNGVSATTDQQGRFVVPATVAGRLSVHCSLAKDAPVLPVLPKGLMLSANETLSLTIRLESPVIVRGVVRTEDTGEPVAGVEINVQDEYRSSFPYVISESDGRYEARILPGEVFTQVISMPKGPPYYRQADGTWNRTTKIAADASTVELPPILLTPLMPLTGKVIDQDDKPVPFVEVNCLLERQENKQRKSLGRGVQTNEQGEFRALIPKGVDAEVFSIRSGNGFGERDANIVQVDPYILRIKTAGAR